MPDPTEFVPQFKMINLRCALGHYVFSTAFSILLMDNLDEVKRTTLKALRDLGGVPRCKLCKNDWVEWQVEDGVLVGTEATLKRIAEIQAQNQRDRETWGEEPKG